MQPIDLNPDQRKEVVNTQQRFQAWRTATGRVRACRGSMVWSETKGHAYLLSSSYDKQGRRRQRSLGARSPETERIKAEFERSRDEANDRLAQMKPVMLRQAAVNRALALGRMPLLTARLLRSLDANGLLGAGLRVLGTNALYAYEAAAGVHIDAGLMATEDVDLLLDSRGGLSFFATEDVDEASLLRLLRRVDRSFERTREAFRAANRTGFLVDLIKPLRNPPWKADPTTVGHASADIEAVEIEGLVWHESSPPFEATVIDERGEPLRIVTEDPRVFAIHKHWLSRRADREPVQRRRDAEQAALTAALVATHMPHLVVDRQSLRMLPRLAVEQALPLFQPSRRQRSAFDP